MKKIIVLLSLVSMLPLLSGCQEADLVGKVAATSFDSLTKAMGSQVSLSPDGHTWIYQSPADPIFNLTKSSDLSEQDISITFDAKPFIAAGLDVAKLPETHLYNAESGDILIAADLGVESYDKNAQSDPSTTFSEVVRLYRDRIGYHEVLDHYGIGLGNGNMVEWAKDLTTNDKDLVFVLNPEPFIAAGVVPESVSNWIFTEVEVKDANGKSEKVDKFLMPFDLKK